MHVDGVPLQNRLHLSRDHDTIDVLGRGLNRGVYLPVVSRILRGLGRIPLVYVLDVVSLVLLEAVKVLLRC